MRSIFNRISIVAKLLQQLAEIIIARVAHAGVIESVHMIHVDFLRRKVELLFLKGLKIMQLGDILKR
jgi:hypothetical protein